MHNGQESDVSTAWHMLESADRLCDADQVQGAIRRMASEITSRMSEEFPLVLTVMGGGIFLAGHILPRLRFPMHCDYIHATRYGGEMSGGSIQWRVPPPESVRARNVLVLDDILDGGQTMSAIRDRVLSLGAATFHCAVLVDKDLQTSKPVHADFVGLQVPDRFIFGCGMDARGYWRNLPEIYALKGQ